MGGDFSEKKKKKERKNNTISLEVVWKAQKPVLGGVMGPKKEAVQCMCSGVYLRRRFRVASFME